MKNALMSSSFHNNKKDVKIIPLAIIGKWVSDLSQIMSDKVQAKSGSGYLGSDGSKSGGINSFKLA